MDIFLHQLNPVKADFPPVSEALEQPNGLLAFAGTLNTPTLLTAYQQGIFPWFNEGEPILWWSPDPRMIIRPESLHISRSMKKELRRHNYQITIDQNFSGVMHQCRVLREHAEGTWITNQMEAAYNQLHREGYAHSVEITDDGELVGGIYGLAMDRMFFGESMFSKKTNASKLAIIYLCRFLAEQGIKILDCQVPNPHLESLGAIRIPRHLFMKYLKRYCRSTESVANWN
ncbi:leucyl/phenylalanyl-tRNA--protein transferase [Endozoicomonas montiporae]|nr:leucyl/phenylalanyl-tRNA--protein transferase [Endozoicomonas montiporae]